MKVDKCLYICHNNSDIKYFEKRLSEHDGAIVSVFGDEANENVVYPVYVGVSDGYLTYVEADEKGVLYPLVVGCAEIAEYKYYRKWKRIDINILKRKDKLERIKRYEV